MKNNEKLITECRADRIEVEEHIRAEVLEEFEPEIQTRIDECLKERRDELTPEVREEVLEATSEEISDAFRRGLTKSSAKKWRIFAPKCVTNFPRPFEQTVSERLTR